MGADARERGSPEARSRLCVCRSLLPRDLCHGRSSSRWLPAKWVLGSISTNKATEGDGIPAELFKILKDDAVKVLHSYVSKFGKLQWSQDWKRSVFIPITKKGYAKECSNYHIIVLISHASKVVLKILQGRLQQYVN